MLSLRKLLPLFVAVIMATQPVIACCGEGGLSATVQPDGNAGSAQDIADNPRPHCGESLQSAPPQHECECGDGCASMQALAPAAPAAALAPPVSDLQPAAPVTRLQPAPPVRNGYRAQGLPPPPAAPPARPTLVSLKRLLLI